MATTRAALRRAAQAAAWLVILVAVAVIAVAVLIPRLGGATPFTIMTSSMEPTYPPGTLVVVRPARVDDIGVGSVITYQLRSGEPTVVTHRVAAVAYGQDGQPQFTTRGDANGVADLEPVLPVQVRGVVWYAVPKAGWLSQALESDERAAAVRAVAGGLGLYAVVMFAGAVRDRRRRTTVGAVQSRREER